MDWFRSKSVQPSHPVNRRRNQRAAHPGPRPQFGCETARRTFTGRQSKNICTHISQRQFSGKKCLQFLKQVPVDLFTEENTGVDRETVDALYSTAILQTERCNDIVPLLNTNLKIITQAAMRLPDCVVAKLFTSFRLVEILFDILVLELFHLRKLHEKNKVPKKVMLKCPPENLDTAKLIIQIIYECLQMVPGYALDNLSQRHRLLEVLFSLLKEGNSHTNSFTMWLLEEIMIASPAKSPIILKDVIGLSELVEKLSGDQLFQFYHLLSALMSDVEYVSSLHSSLEKHDQWLVTTTVNVSEVNQKFLLSVPTFLEKMCNTLCQPLLANRRRQVDYVTHILTETLGLSNSDIGVLMEQSLGEQDNVFYQMNLFQEKTTRADIFLIVSLLLSGNYRNEVQDRLVQLKFMTKLHRVFKSVVWENLLQDHFNSEHHSMAGHEDCHPNTVIRIQFLRLIHSVADSHTNRYFLLSCEELEELPRIALKKHIEMPPDLASFDSSKLFQGERGILSEIVDLLKLEPSSSCVRFWITRAMEAFLRGEMYVLDQYFLLEKGLVEEILEQLISSQPRVDMVAQGNFDFLSAVMRKNVEAFERCERVLDCFNKFQRLLAAIDLSLVDSNMFIRCVMLTVNFIRCNKPQYLHMLESCRVLNHFSKMQVCIEITTRMVGLLTVSTLSQENVSCLNTSLLVFILASRNGELAKYLRAFSESSDDNEVLCNFIRLLRFWQVHYTLPMKKTDCKSLEMSSGIKFVEWLDVVQLMLSDDTTCPLSIAHYLQSSPTHKYSNTIPKQTYRTS